MTVGAITGRIAVGNTDVVFPPALSLTEVFSDGSGGAIALQLSSLCIRVGGIAVSDDSF